MKTWPQVLCVITLIVSVQTLDCQMMLSKMYMYTQVGHTTHTHIHIHHYHSIHTVSASCELLHHHGNKSLQSTETCSILVSVTYMYNIICIICALLMLSVGLHNTCTDTCTVYRYFRQVAAFEFVRVCCNCVWMIPFQMVVKYKASVRANDAIRKILRTL